MSETPRGPASGRRSVSFLVRFWQEGRKVSDGMRPVRGYVRNLRTGEERYVTATEAVAEILRLGLEGAHQAEEAAPSPAPADVDPTT